MAREATEIAKIENRIRDLSVWLEENATDCRAEQKHLEEGSHERAYWHYGYMVALRDTLALLTGERRTGHAASSADTSGLRSQA